MEKDSLLELFSGNITSNSSTPLYVSTLAWICSVAVALPENVIWLITSGAGNGATSEFFSLNLSVCEILLCVQSLASLLTPRFPVLWGLVEFLVGLSLTGRPVFQCLICVECYLAVVHPFVFLRLKPLRYRMLFCSVAWLEVFLSCVFASSLRLYVVISVSVCQALAILTVKLFCCLSVLRALRRSGPGERGREEEDRMKRRAFRVILIILMAMLVIYAAYLVAGLTYVLTHRFIPDFWNAGNVCFVMGGLVQPLLYLYKTGTRPRCNRT